MRIKAFSLLEVSVVLAIIGILSVAVLQGQKILFQAKIEKTAALINTLTTQVSLFQNQYGTNPGSENTSFESKGSMTENFWNQLSEAQLFNPKNKIPAIGGKIDIKNEKGSFYIVLTAENGKGILNSKDALKLTSKLESNASIKNGNGTNSCVNQNGEVNINNQEKSCIIEIEL